MILLHHVFIEVAYKTLKRVDHVVDLDTVDELGVVPELGLHAVKLGVQFL